MIYKLTRCISAVILAASFVVGGAWMAKAAGSFDIAVGNGIGTTSKLGVAISSIIKINLLPVVHIDLDPVTTENDQESLAALQNGDVDFALVTLDNPALRASDNVLAMGLFGNTDTQTRTLLARKDVDPAVVQNILITIFKSVGVLSAVDAELTDYEPESAVAGLTLPVHDGAKAFYAPLWSPPDEDQVAAAIAAEQAEAAAKAPVVAVETLPILDEAVADAVVSDSTVPETAVLETTVSDAAISDSTVSETTVSEAAVSDAAIADPAGSADPSASLAKLDSETGSFIFYFDFDEDQLDETAKKTLLEAAAFASSLGAPPIVVAAYTDSVGDADYNSQLAQRRAESVMQGLDELGVAYSQFDLSVFGQPAQGSGTPGDSDEANNRRVDLLIGEQEPTVEEQPVPITPGVTQDVVTARDETFTPPTVAQPLPPRPAAGGPVKKSPSSGPVQPTM